MTFRYERSYRGPIRAVILDWAGTTMDFGCQAPALVYVEVFRRAGVPISIAEARAPMGAHKRDHLQAITEIEDVRRRWTEAHGRPPEEADIDRMYAEFVPLQVACLSDHSELIPGTLEAIETCRERGYRIGTTTGYTREMMEVNLADAARQGYAPDATVCASDVPVGRPLPFMCLKAAIDLEVSPLAACVKVDDTPTGIEEGLNAGMWTVGFAVSGNEVGLTRAEWTALSEAEQEVRRAQATDRLRRAGAHEVVDSIRDLIPCLDAIEARLARGEKP